MSRKEIIVCDFCKGNITEISNPHTLKANLPKPSITDIGNIRLEWDLHPSCALEISSFLHKIKL